MVIATGFLRASIDDGVSKAIYVACHLWDIRIDG